MIRTRWRFGVMGNGHAVVKASPCRGPAAVMLVEGPADVVAVARLRQSLSAKQYQ